MAELLIKDSKFLQELDITEPDHLFKVSEAITQKVNAALPLYRGEYDLSDTQLIDAIVALHYLIAGKLIDALVLAHYYKSIDAIFQCPIDSRLNEDLKREYTELQISSTDNINKAAIQYDLLDLFVYYHNTIDTQTAFISGCEKGALKIVQYLVSMGADIHGGFSVACENGHLAVVQYLVSKGAVIHAKDDYGFRYACVNGHWEVVKYLASIDANNNDGRVFWVCIFGHLSIVQYLESMGTNIHTDNDHGFCCACKYGHLDIVQYLVSKGANIHADNDAGFRGACRSKKGLELVQYLVSQDANIHAHNNEGFIMAYYCNNLAVVQYLQSIDPTLQRPV